MDSIYNYVWDGKLDSAYIKANELIEGGRSNSSSHIEALNLMANIEYINGDIYSARELMERCVPFIDSTGIGIDLITISAMNYAAILNDYGAFLAADNFLQSLVEKRSDELRGQNLFDIYKQLAISKMWINDTESSLVLLKKCIDIANSNTILEHDQIYLLIGTCLTKQSKFTEARNWFDKAIYNNKIGQNNNTSLEAVRGITNTYIKEKKLNLAHESLSKIEHTSINGTSYEKGMYFLLKAHAYNLEGKNVEALSSIQEAIRELKISYANSINNKVLRAHLVKFKALLDSGDTCFARIAIADGLDDFENSKKMNIGKDSYLDFLILQFLTSIPDSLPLLSEAIQLIHEMRGDIQSLDSKIERSQRSREVYDLAVPAAIRAFRNSDSMEDFYRAMYWADLSKGGVLSEQIARDRIIRRYENDTLYQHFVELTSDIHALRKQIIDQKKNQHDSHILTKAQEILLEKRNELKALEDSTDFVHHLLTQEEFVNHHLSHSSSVYQIYSSDSSYFFLLHQPNAPPWVKDVRRDSLDTLLNRYINMQKSQETNPSDFLTLSHTLYSTLFPDEFHQSKCSHLTIVPDGLFHQFSFESLTTQLNETTSLKNAQYLFYSTPISYSLGLHLSKDFSEKNSPSTVLAMAPGFDQNVSAVQRDCANEVFGSLTCNQREVEELAHLFGGSIFVKSDATKSNFTSKVDDHSIIHLATHACIDTTNYYKSAIVLDDGQLLMSDLYNLNFHNKTVVLSACNTAHGREVSGEGVFNFARTLTELGCKEVVVSLWPIDDCSTADFIQEFYRERKKLSSTAKALQQARKKFIKSSDKLHAMPLFWAPLIVISNDQDVGIQPDIWSIPTLYFVLFSTIGMVVFGRWIYRRNRTRRN